jgi:hypothetical protein
MLNWFRLQIAFQDTHHVSDSTLVTLQEGRHFGDAPNEVVYDAISSVTIIAACFLG